MPEIAASLSEERIAYLEGLVTQARTAAAVFTQYTQEDVDRIVKPMVLAGLEQAQYLARLAIEETRLGVVEDKALKNMVATEFVYNYIKDKRTVGAIREFPERGVVEVAEPIGVIFSLTQITHLLAHPDYEPHLDHPLQMHHGHQDAQRGYLQSASRCGALLLRGGADHV
jgi:acyl-CoA reductase-like NAD-dependent aldehyde dehydrogenase